MPTIIREFRCGDCNGTFESTDPIDDVVCPHCTAADSAERVFLTPPAIRDQKTSIADRELKNLAADFGMSNMTNREGSAVRAAPDGAAAPAFTNHNPQIAAQLAKLGSNADGFSGVLPTLRQAGGPRKWNKVPERK